MSAYIRVASHSDIGRIIPLWNEFMDSHLDEVPYLWTNKDRDLSAIDSIGRRISAPDHQFFLYEDKEELTAFLSCQIVPPNHLIQETGGYITETVVKDSLQRNGIGTRLFEVACDWMFQKGATSIWLKATINNEAVNTFCQKAGFRPVFQHMVYQPK